MTNRTLILERILEYIDVPQLFLGRDSFDTQYLCLLYEDEPICRYTSIRISTNRFAAYCQGKIDLRALFVEAESRNEYFDLTFQNGEYIMATEPFSTITEDRLPEEGFYHDSSDDEMITVAVPKRERFSFFQLMRKHGWVAM